MGVDIIKLLECKYTDYCLNFQIKPPQVFLTTLLPLPFFCGVPEQTSEIPFLGMPKISEASLAVLYSLIKFPSKSYCNTKLSISQ